jgi:D-alanyl-D-alanine dipeptidase
MVIRKNFKYFILSSFLSCACFANELPKGFVYLNTIDSGISQKIEFSSNNNFLGCRADGYEGEQVVCTKALALALKDAQIALKKSYPNYSLQVLDAYRPVRAVTHIQKWAKDFNDQKTKLKYYPYIDKKDLLGTFLASKKSSHSRGSTVDLIIIDNRTGQSLDFGPEYFGDYTHFNYKGLTKVQKFNRNLLRKIMLDHNFKPYDAEFWHFTLINEPFPEKYFDFPIRNKEN